MNTGHYKLLPVAQQFDFFTTTVLRDVNGELVEWLIIRKGIARLGALPVRTSR